MIFTADKRERRNERIAISLPMTVEARETDKRIWRELTNLEIVSDSGVGFYLSRVFEIGQLLLLRIPLDKNLRRYDHDEELYGVWAIVRHCHRSLRSQIAVYQFGMAFIGRDPPYSYRQNPQTVYILGELDEKTGFWRITENARQTLPRRNRRYTMPIEIYLTVCDADEKVIAHENTVTENISESGASVFSTLQLEIGDAVKLTKQSDGFSANAIVRNRRVGKDHLPRLHLEFINSTFPLEGID